MKTICAWCNRRLDGDAEDAVVSRGLCGTCAGALEKLASLKDSAPPERILLNRALDKQGWERKGDLVYLISGKGPRGFDVHDSDIAVVVRYPLTGSVCEQGGIRFARYRKNPIVLHAHDYEGLPIARSLWERVRDMDSELPTLIAKLQFHRDTELSRNVWEDIKTGALYFVELGALPETWSVTNGIASVQAWSLLEISLAKANQ